uniref:Cytochrome b n=1 Tax=Mesabolivar sp. ITV1036I2 TaxID=2508675 RepID=A0A411FES0_9ARAC|nr:cytochrome b [Mesabolivar sp. ITV1036I2]
MLVDLSSPSSLSYMWGFGSLLGLFFMVQLASGLFLSMHYVGYIGESFNYVVHMMRDVNGGWFFRVIHSNGASGMFVLMYIHMGRGLYYHSYVKGETWMSGVTIFLLTMAIAFLGYVLPWGQMSFWAATVITNLLSAIPYVGGLLVEWIWGGFSVSGPTLVRFFSFHFLFPFVLLFFVILHLVFLHDNGSSNFLGLFSGVDRIIFYPYYVIKDIVGFVFCLGVLIVVSLWIPFVFMDVENFIPANPLVTPVHIQPEWYFLFAYAILRSIPSKIGGVVALLMSVFVLYLLPLFSNYVEEKSSSLSLGGSFVFFMFSVIWLMLTWCGACVVEYPYVILSQLFSFMYFLMFVLMVVVKKWFYMWVFWKYSMS